MEQRTLLASSITADGLEFSADSFTNGQSSGTVLIGYAPAAGGQFYPLLSTNGVVTITGSDATTFTIGAESDGDAANLCLYSLSGTPAFWSSSSTVTFDIDSLTSSSGFALGAGTAQAVTVADIPFYATNLALFLPTNGTAAQSEVLLQGNLDFTNSGLTGLMLGVGGGNNVEVTTGTDGNAGTISLNGTSFSSSSGFSAYGVTVAGQVTASYDAAASNTFNFTGSVTFSADGMLNVGATLGSTQVMEGTVDSISLAPTASFQLFGLEIIPADLTFQYPVKDEQFGMWGSLTASVSGVDSITATMGTSSDPGLVVCPTSGDVTAVNMSISGSFSLLGLGITSSDLDPATFVYSASTDEFEISGQVSVPSLFDATVKLGTQTQPGLTIIDGDWSVNNLQISLSSVPMGAFEIQQLVVDYTQSTPAEATVDVSLSLQFPEDWTVGGSIQFGIDEATGFFDVQNISLSFQADSTASAIAIGDTGLFLTEMSATVQNIDQPSNLTVSGTMEAVYGDEVTIFGQTAAFFQVDGSFFVDKDELSLTADAYFGAVTSNGKTTGLLGHGTGTMTLDWDNNSYSLSTSSSLLDGTFTYDDSFQFNAGNNVLLSANANVNVPDGIPLIGGDNLGGMSFLFEYQAPSSAGGQAGGFIAAWTTIDLLVTHVGIGIEYNYINDDVIVLGSGAIANLQAQASAEGQTYTYSQSFTVPEGATQAILEADWTGNAVLANLVPTIMVGGTGLSNVTVTSTSTGTFTLLQDTGLTSPTQNFVGIVGSTSNQYTALAVQPGGQYTIYATFTSDTAPTDTTADIASISDGPSAGEVLITFTSGSVPVGIQVGDTVSLSGTKLQSGSGSYDTSSSSPPPTVQEITGNGVILNLSYIGQASGGTLSGWTLPQFSATWYIPPPTISINSLPGSVESGTLQVTMPVQVASSLGQPSVDLYIAPYDASLGLNQTFNGTLISPTNTSWVNASSANAGQSGYTATYTVSLNGLLPTSYYFYAVVNDGTNPAVTSNFTGADQVVENNPVISGLVQNQNNEGLSGWTVFLDANNNDLFDDNEAYTTTNSSGFYGFFSNQVTEGTPVYVDLVNLDSDVYSFASPADGSVQVTYYGTSISAPFTVTQVPSIEGIVFLDSAQTGVSANQPGLGGWTVFLDNNDNGQLDAGEPSTITTSTGAYTLYGLTIGQTYTVAVLTNTGASAIYSFDAVDVSGTTVYDIAGDPNMLEQAGTLNGGASVGPPGSYGLDDHDYASNNDQILSLDGSTGYLSVPGNTNLQPGTGGFTVGAWVQGAQQTVGINNGTIASTVSGDGTTGGWSLGLSLSSNIYTENLDNGTQTGTPDVYAGDFNGDGLPDALAIYPSGLVSVLLNTTEPGNVSPSFSQAYSYTVSNGGDSMPSAVADFNGDGLADFALADYSGNSILVFLSQSAGAGSTALFAVSVISNIETPVAIAAVALGGADSLPDLVVVGGGTSSPGVTVLVNETTQGSDSLDFATEYAANLLGTGYAVYNQIVPGDFNGDGFTDVVIGSQTGGVQVLINTRNEKDPLEDAYAYFAAELGSAGFGSVGVGDFNDDGNDDIAYVVGQTSGTGLNSLNIWVSTMSAGSSIPTFDYQQVTVGSNPSDLVVADLNGDGSPDVAVANYGDGSVTVLLNTTAPSASTASFASTTYQPVGVGTPTILVAGNFYGGPLPDLVVMDGSSEWFDIFQNATTPGSSSANFVMNDFSNDGYFGAANAAVADFAGSGMSSILNSTPGTSTLALTFNHSYTNIVAQVQENPASGAGSLTITSQINGGLLADTWYYLTFTYDPGAADQLSLYINGQLVTQAVVQGSLSDSPIISGATNFDMLIGALPGSIISQFFDGYIDEVSVWPTALDADQVLALYGGGMAPTYVQTTPLSPNTDTVTIPSNGIAAGNNFGEYDTGTIIGSVTGTPLDSTTSEPLDQWTVNLLNSSNVVVATAVTGSTGYYFFYGLKPGNYTIQQVLQQGWQESSPGQGTPIAVTTYEDTVSTVAAFTDTQVAQVSGDVYVDANSNGAQDVGEVGTADATVYLDTNNNSQLDADEPSATTKADGSYAFTGLASGRYVVRLVNASPGAMTQPSGEFYVADVSEQGTVGGLDFGVSPLVIAPIANVTVAEGSPVSFVVQLAQSEAGQPTYFYLAPGAPAGATIATNTGAFAWTPATPGTYTVVVVAYAAGTPIATDSQTFTITVTDVAPVVTLGPGVPITSGCPFTLSGSFADPGTDRWTGTVDYGDGRGPQPLLLGLDKTFDLDHVYQTPGTYQVTVVIHDGYGGIGTARTSVVVLPSSGPVASGFGAGPDAFVKTLYRVIAGQEPGPASLTYWSGRLHAGASRLAVAHSIWNSIEPHNSKHGALASKVRFVRAFWQAVRAGKMARKHAALQSPVAPQSTPPGSWPIASPDAS